MQIARNLDKMILFLILQFMFISAENCGKIVCSNIFDHVCGLARTQDGVAILSKYQNVCHLNKIRCRLKYIVELTEVPDELCDIRKKRYSASGRRLTDFSVVGAHQACNHTCPTYCVDTYEPACAQIWKRDMTTFDYRPMINHCHIDLFSCAVGVNVTIQPLGKCYHNPSGLLFMSQVAAMKSLKLLDDTSIDLEYNIKSIDNSATFRTRRNYNDDDGIDWQLVNLLRRIIN